MSIIIVMAEQRKPINLFEEEEDNGNEQVGVQESPSSITVMPASPSADIPETKTPPSIVQSPKAPTGWQEEKPDEQPSTTYMPGQSLEQIKQNEKMELEKARESSLTERNKAVNDFVASLIAKGNITSEDIDTILNAEIDTGNIVQRIKDRISSSIRSARRHYPKMEDTDPYSIVFDVLNKHPASFLPYLNSVLSNLGKRTLTFSRFTNYKDAGTPQDILRSYYEGEWETDAAKNSDGNRMPWRQRIFTAKEWWNKTYNELAKYRPDLQLPPLSISGSRNNQLAALSSMRDAFRVFLKQSEQNPEWKTWAAAHELIPENVFENGMGKYWLKGEMIAPEKYRISEQEAAAALSGSVSQEEAGPTKEDSKLSDIKVDDVSKLRSNRIYDPMYLMSTTLKDKDWANILSLVNQSNASVNKEVSDLFGKLGEQEKAISDKYFSENNMRISRSELKDALTDFLQRLKIAKGKEGEVVDAYFANKNPQKQNIDIKNLSQRWNSLLPAYPSTLPFPDPEANKKFKESVEKKEQDKRVMLDWLAKKSTKEGTPERAILEAISKMNFRQSGNRKNTSIYHPVDRQNAEKNKYEIKALKDTLLKDFDLHNLAIRQQKSTNNLLIEWMNNAIAQLLRTLGNDASYSEFIKAMKDQNIDVSSFPEIKTAFINMLRILKIAILGTSRMQKVS